MKKSIIPFLLLLTSIVTNSQTITFTDPTFKRLLLELYAFDNEGNRIVIDQNSNGEIEVEEAEKVYELHISDGDKYVIQYNDEQDSYKYFAISNLEGIENFINLKSLTISPAESYTYIDLSSLKNINYLFVDNTQFIKVKLGEIKLNPNNPPNYNGITCTCDIESVSFKGDIPPIFARYINFLEWDGLGKTYNNLNYISALFINKLKLINMTIGDDSSLSESQSVDEIAIENCNFSNSNFTFFVDDKIEIVNSTFNILNVYNHLKFNTPLYFQQVNSKCNYLQIGYYNSFFNLKGFLPLDDIKGRIYVFSTESTFCIDQEYVDFYFNDDFEYEKAFNDTNKENINSDCAPISLSSKDFVFEPEFSSFPNPVTSNWSVLSENGSTINKIELFNLSGQLISTDAVNDSNITMDLSYLPKGIYVVKINTNNGFSMTKIMKE